MLLFYRDRVHPTHSSYSTQRRLGHPSTGGFRRMLRMKSRRLDALRQRSRPITPMYCTRFLVCRQSIPSDRIRLSMFLRIAYLHTQQSGRSMHQLRCSRTMYTSCRSSTATHACVHPLTCCQVNDKNDSYSHRRHHPFVYPVRPGQLLQYLAVGLSI